MNLPEKVEKALTGEDGAHAIQCDCDFDPVCDDPTHQSPEYHIGTECSIVQDSIRAAIRSAIEGARVEVAENICGFFSGCHCVDCDDSGWKAAVKERDRLRRAVEQDKEESHG